MDEQPRPDDIKHRFTLIDGLRGLAASMVVVYHFAGHRAFFPLRDAMPEWLYELLRRGGTGVAIFFVISGFVIAHSIGKAKVTTGYFANFALRRSIRLDPPYWATIALIIGLGLLKSVVTNAEETEFPSLWSLATHVTYTFQIFGVTELSSVFWTLCHEVQFYVLFCFLCALIPRGPWLLSVIAITGAASSLDLVKVQGVCLETWYMFALGVLLYYAYSTPTLWPRSFAIGYVVFLLATLPWHYANYRAAALAAACLLGVAALTGGLTTWLSGVPIQYLGRISYSLYLTHSVVGWLALSLVSDYVGIHNPWQAAAWTVAAIVLCIGFAHGMYRLVESPSMRLAKKLKRKNT